MQEKNKIEFIIKEENKGLRLDKCIAILDNEISRMAAQRMIEEGNIKVNGNSLKPSYKTALNDKIEILKEEPKETSLKGQDIPIDILYEDQDIIVVNKPKGIVVHPANGNPDGTLVNAIMNICKGSLSGIGGEIRPRDCT